MVGGRILTAGILKHDLAPDFWASLKGTESSQAGVGAAEGTIAKAIRHLSGT